MLRGSCVVGSARLVEGTTSAKAGAGAAAKTAAPSAREMARDSLLRIVFALDKSGGPGIVLPPRPAAQGQKSRVSASGQRCSGAVVTRFTASRWHGASR